MFLYIYLINKSEACRLNHLEIDKYIVVIYTLQLQYKILVAIYPLGKDYSCSYDASTFEKWSEIRSATPKVFARITQPVLIGWTKSVSVMPLIDFHPPCLANIYGHFS